MKKKIIVSGVGCCLVEQLFNNINFNSEEIKPFLSKFRGDGGLSLGKLVFLEEFENYFGSNLDNFIQSVISGRNSDKTNIGGPSIVSLIHAAQMTERENCEIRFYGRARKIGRSFIGQIFSRSGFEAVFVDISQVLIDELNRKGQHNVVTKCDERDEVLIVRHVRGILLGDTEKVIYELSGATIAALSVGQQGLPEA